MCDFSKITVGAREALNNSSHEDCANEILALRQSIDNIDNAVIALLTERFKCTEKVGVIKARNHISPEDKVREKSQIIRLKEVAKNAGLSEDIALQYHNFVVTEAKRRHKEIANSDNQENSENSTSC